jgi:hypothetical protein
MQRHLRFALAASVAFFLPACGGLDSLGPTPFDEGIIFYIHADFSGSSQQINADVRDLGDVEGPCGVATDDSEPTWDDCISSIRVMPGWAATLFEDDEFRGGRIEITADTPDLRALRGPCDDDSYNDCVSSIRVYRR